MIKASDLERASAEVRTMLGDVLKCMSFLSDLQKQIQAEIDAKVADGQLLTPEAAAAAENKMVVFAPKLPFAALSVLNLSDDQHLTLKELTEQ